MKSCNYLYSVNLSEPEEGVWVFNIGYKTVGGKERYTAMLFRKGDDMVSEGINKWDGFPNDCVSQYFERTGEILREDCNDSSTPK